MRHAYQERWHHANREKELQRMREWAEANRARKREYNKAWRAANPGRHTALEQERRQRMVRWADREAIAAIYAVSAAWQEAGVENQVDHIIPVKGRLVSGLHVHENLTILPRRDNARKYNLFEVH